MNKAFAKANSIRNISFRAVAPIAKGTRGKQIAQIAHYIEELKKLGLQIESNYVYVNRASGYPDSTIRVDNGEEMNMMGTKIGKIS